MSGRSMWEPRVESEQWVAANEDGQTRRQSCGTYDEVGNQSNSSV